MNGVGMRKLITAESVQVDPLVVILVKLTVMTIGVE